MAYVTPHGGGCCGIRHLIGFYNALENEVQTILKGLDSDRRPRGRAVEVALTDAQSKKYGDILAAIGFIPVFRFINSNTKNTITVYFFHESPLPLDNLPFSFDTEKGRTVVEEMKKQNTRTRRPRYGEIRHGEVVVVTNRNSKYHGRRFVITGVSGNEYVTVRPETVSPFTSNPTPSRLAIFSLSYPT